MADRATLEDKALLGRVKNVVDALDDVARLCDAAELAAMGLDEPRDASALKQLVRVIGDQVRAASETLMPAGG